MQHREGRSTHQSSSGVHGKGPGLWNQLIWVPVPALPLISSVTLTLNKSQNSLLCRAARRIRRGSENVHKVADTWWVLRKQQELQQP